MSDHPSSPHVFDEDASPAVLEAAALDKAGRHRDAIAVLSRAAMAGDLVAKRKVGLRILLGDRAPCLGEQGVRLIAEAGMQGDAAAAELCAVLVGAGIHRRQNWNEALDWLQLAAELGSSRARGALGVLCSDPALAAEAERGEVRTDHWRRLRANVDMATLLFADVGRTLNVDPPIRVYERFVDARVCKWLVTRARGRLSPALGYNPERRALEKRPERTNTSAGFTLEDADLVQIGLQARIAAAIGARFPQFESPFLLHYAPGETFHDHYDFVDPDTPDYDQELARNGQRIATFLIYLNEDNEGGGTAFPRLGLSHKGKAGEGFCFINTLPDGTADLRTLHAGRPPRTGEKWVFTQFIRDRAVVPGTSTETTAGFPTVI